MNELGLQKFVCDVVNDAGGYALKRNNRFMVGIVDLLVKLPSKPGYFRDGLQACPPAGILEVKQRLYPSSDRRFLLDVTAPQKNDLRRADAAGMPAGVISFLQRGSGSGLVLFAHVMTYRTASYGDNTGIEPWTTWRGAHMLLGKKGEREHAMLSALYNWQKEWREGK